jgi:hypothetical protein
MLHHGAQALFLIVEGKTSTGASSKTTSIYKKADKKTSKSES